MDDFDASSLQRELWMASVPVQFTLAPNEVDENIEQGEEPPKPFFMVIPRMSYLSLHVDEVAQYFSRFVDKERSNMWFSFQGKPVKWSYPAGVLYDSCVESRSSDLWELTFHLSNFPFQELLEMKSEKDAKCVFMNSLKESFQIVCGSTQAVMTMSSSDEQLLWNGFRNMSCREVNSIMDKLRTKEEVSCCAVRLHRMGSPTLLRKADVSQDEPSPLINLLEKWIPNLMKEENDQESPLHLKFCVQGVNVNPKTMTIEWLYDHCTYPDGFIHISIVS